MLLCLNALGAVRAAACRARPRAESRAVRNPLSHGACRTRPLLRLAAREAASGSAHTWTHAACRRRAVHQPAARAAVCAASSAGADEPASPEVEFKPQHVANLGKMRTVEQRMRVRSHRDGSSRAWLTRSRNAGCRAAPLEAGGQARGCVRGHGAASQQLLAPAAAARAQARGTLLRCAARVLGSRALRPRCRSQNQRFHRAVKKAAVAKAANPGAAKRAAPPLAPPAAAKMNVQQLGQYQEDLRLYRELRGELQARAKAAAGRLELGSRSYAPARALQMWSDAFAEEKGRRPDRKDVSDTGIKWLVRCQHHLRVMRARVLTRRCLLLRLTGTQHTQR